MATLPRGWRLCRGGRLAGGPASGLATLSWGWRLCLGAGGSVAGVAGLATLPRGRRILPTRTLGRQGGSDPGFKVHESVLTVAVIGSHVFEVHNKGRVLQTDDISFIE